MPRRVFAERNLPQIYDIVEFSRILKTRACYLTLKKYSRLIEIVDSAYACQFLLTYFTSADTHFCKRNFSPRRNATNLQPSQIPPEESSRMISQGWRSSRKLVLGRPRVTRTTRKYIAQLAGSRSAPRY